MQTDKGAQGFSTLPTLRPTIRSLPRDSGEGELASYPRLHLLSLASHADSLPLELCSGGHIPFSSPGSCWAQKSGGLQYQPLSPRQDHMACNRCEPGRAARARVLVSSASVPGVTLGRLRVTNQAGRTHRGARRLHPEPQSVWTLCHR